MSVCSVKTEITGEALIVEGERVVGSVQNCGGRKDISALTLAENIVAGRNGQSPARIDFQGTVHFRQDEEGVTLVIRQGVAEGVEVAVRVARITGQDINPTEIVKLIDTIGVNSPAPNRGAARKRSRPAQPK